MMENTYWDETGAYQKDYDRLVELLPYKMAEANTIAGEMLLAIGTLWYEFYNNGMENNTSHAVNMLRDRNAINQDTWETIYPFTRGRRYEGNYNGDSFQLAVESSGDQTIRYILDNPELETTLNTQDMLDWQDDMEKDDDDFEVEYVWINGSQSNIISTD
jgi:hypothetical protein